MHENDTIRELLEAALQKLNDASGNESPAPLNTSPQVGALHPGLERFTIIESSEVPSGKKPCYLEPDRPCVKSGACEMRGY